MLKTCDSCGHLQQLNEHFLCEPCEKSAQAFQQAARQARLAGESREAAHKAGKAAMKDDSIAAGMERIKALSDEILNDDDLRNHNHD